ncbi:MAG: murein biosynthesis integral membrane protein MurJ [Solirubrobacteraceae bacterium]|nr:murein biosynthesis integral membrane protein MurJ [Solirubrobacteraceae bacterium]
MDPDPRRDPGLDRSDEILDTAASRRYAERMAARAARGEKVGDVAERRAGRRRPKSRHDAAPVAPRSADDYAGDVDALAESAPATESRPSAASGRARNTAIFSLLTGFSRIAGLLREMLAAGFYGTTGPASAFTLAFQIPNLLRSLFADAALSAAFVPVFSDLLQQKRRKEAFSLAANLAWVVLLALSAVTAISILLTPLVVPLLTSDLSDADTTLAVHLTQIMFPVVALLGLNGLLVGILNAEDHFTIPALSPVIWNLLIMAFMIGTHVAIDDPGDQLYGYAIGVLVGTVAQLLMAVPLVRRKGFKLGRLRWNTDGQVRQVLVLMLPVALGLGLVNFNLLINSTLGFKISEAVPRAIDAAFRLYMMPQGIFSVAIATVLFPALSRAAARHDHGDLRAIIGDGMRLILVLLIPAAAVSIALAAPIVRLVFQRGEFDAESTKLAAEALWVFSITLPLNGLNLLLTRTFFALKDPWTTTRLAVLSLLVNLVVSVALYKPLGVGGIVAGTVAANIAVVGAQIRVLRSRLGGSLGLMRTATAAVRILVAAAVLAAVCVGVDAGVRSVLGDGVLSLAIAIGASLAIGGAAYLAILRALGVKEAVRLESMVRGRLGRA